ncbi:phosphoglycerate dehydrogenase [Saccharospirillum impatiens]|uniref:phosphoglycerate dehydrogenase n=1 Tax=Saccharospirillum impatiens TaxID=169438 RepID=UPI0004048B39|nr:phosphoglycerate dehydrogenase [Saccharospirillum impatiens]
MKKVLVTCPPMLGLIHEFMAPASKLGLELVPAKTTQVLSEEELIDLLPAYDGWIIGDDPATQQVFKAGKKGNLSAAVKWGIGVDNVDFQACKELGIPIINTPNMFGGEVADVAIGYITGLARRLFEIDRGVRIENAWFKPAGMSLTGKKVGIIGFGDIGKSLAKRLGGFDIQVTAYDPGVEGDGGMPFVSCAEWPKHIEEQDFLVFTCSLNKHNFHMLDRAELDKCKDGVFIINVARGPLIHEPALVKALRAGKVSAAALDVFEEEPLPSQSELRKFPRCIFGSHNGSNTVEGVRRASFQALKEMKRFLDE